VIREAYLEIVLRLARIAPELVDSWCGPPGVAARVEAEPPPTRERLRAQIRELLAVEEDRWVRAQLEALDVAAQWLDGRHFEYAELVERCHGVRPEVTPEDVFAEAHRRLDEALPGSGRVAERYRAWHATQVVPVEALPEAVDALVRELRERTRRKYGLPEGESADVELVSGERWAAFARYLGGGRSRILINTDLPIPSFRLLEVVAHEIYPGHHTDASWKDNPVMLLPTPQPLVSEGTAMVALEALLGDDAEEVAAACVRPLGIPYDIATAAVVRSAQEALVPLEQNVELLGLSREDAAAYARRWLLEPDDYVDKWVESVFGQPWRPYTSCYPEGLRLCREFVGGDPERFGRLLRERLTPAELRSAPPPRIP